MINNKLHKNKVDNKKKIFLNYTIILNKHNNLLNKSINFKIYINK